MPVQRTQHVLPPEPQSARAARAVLRTCLDRWELSAWQDDASLVLSELVTNAVVHARTVLRIDIACDEQWLEVSVVDDSPWPVQQRPHRHDVASDVTALLEAERRFGPGLDERDGRLHVGASGTLAGGRGLILVEALSDQWGVSSRDVGKAVWARFALARREQQQ